MYGINNAYIRGLCATFLFVALSFSYAEEVCRIELVEDTEALNAWAYSPSALGPYTLCPLPSTQSGDCVEYAGYEISSNGKIAQPLLHFYFQYSDGRPPSSHGVRINSYRAISVPYIEKEICEPTYPQSCTLVDTSNVDSILSRALASAYSNPENVSCEISPQYTDDGWAGVYGLQCQNSSGHLNYVSTVALPTSEGTGEQCAVPSVPPAPPVVEKPSEPTTPPAPPELPPPPPNGEINGNINTEHSDGSGSGGSGGSGGGSSSSEIILEGDFLTDAQLKYRLEEYYLKNKYDQDVISDGLRGLENAYKGQVEALDFGIARHVVNVQDYEEKYTFKLGEAVCPPPYILTFVMFGRTINFELKYNFICNFAEIMGYLVLASAYMTSAYIMLGLRKV